MYEQIINVIDIGIHIQGLKVNDLALHKIGGEKCTSREGRGDPN